MTASIRRWLLRPGPLGADGPMAVVLIVVTLAELRRTGVGDLSPYAVAAASVVVCGAVAWRRVAALPVALLVYGGILALLASGFAMDNLGHFGAHLLVSYSLGAHTRGWTAHPAVALAVIAGVAVLAPLAIPAGADAVGVVVLVAGACLLGRLSRRRDQAVVDLRSRAERLEREREVRAAAAVAEERTRIARELHDVVAHAVSLMVLQTGAGRKAVRTDPARATGMLLSAEESGRQALAEMKRLVGIMRSGEPSLAPQPGLADVPRLVENSRGSGKPVELTVVGEAVPLPPGLDLAAYRIVQEALTNTIKHAGTESAALVRVEYGVDAVHLEVADEGPPGGLVWPPRNTGHGLAGMRERAALYGGVLDVAPNNVNGLRVAASLPVEGGL